MIINMTGGGRGAALNFKVVPGLTQPGTAVENTIWVKTEKIGAWYFSATQPEGLQEWDVWFQTGTESATEFNALKKNALQVYPLSTKQMVGGVLADIDAMSYQNGEWVDWIKYLFNYGNQSYEWQTRAWAYNSAGTGKLPTVSANADGSISLSLTASSGQYLGGAYELVEDIDLSSIKTLELVGEYSGTFSGAGDCNLYLLAINRSTAYWGGAAASQAIAYTSTEFPITLDVSGLNGTYDIALTMYSGGKAGSHSFKFEQLKMLE